ncbi:hypothetical protein QFC21_001106 [Naganishia friedmannii]|uniref:Uncharacterized protein n=1 Tax=Naganishia friedmannii TaxID=89922 RepID=A0ACC2W8B8_9TREE|nr:hypothetical protein QFC21_001106 [Naganishia friedmannii]
MILHERTPQRVPELAANDLPVDATTGKDSDSATPVEGDEPESQPSAGNAAVTSTKENTGPPAGKGKPSNGLHKNTSTDGSASSSTALTNGKVSSTAFTTSVAAETGSSSTGASGSVSDTSASSTTLSAWSSSSSSSWVAPSPGSSSASASSTFLSSSQASWTGNPAPASTSWTADSWENKQVEPATSSSTWTSEWSQPSTESSSSWSEAAWTSSSSSFSQEYSAPADTLPSQEHSFRPAVSISASSRAPSIDIPGPTPSIVGTLTDTGNIVSSTGLITNGRGNSSAEAANGSGADGEQKKIGNMGVGPFAGLLVGLLILAIVGYLIGDRWHKKKTGDSTPLWRRFVNKFRDRDPNDGTESFNQYKSDPFIDQLEKSHHKKKASPIDDDASFYNTARSSKWLTPITPLEPHNFAGRGQEPFGWLAPPPPAMSGSGSILTQHPRASQYMPTSGRIRQSEVPAGRMEPSRPESDEILADYHRDSAYENLIDDPVEHMSKRSNSTKRKTNMTEGSVYSVDSIWGNASEAPPTARSSLHSSFLPWRRSNSVDSVATQLPAVPAIPDHLAYHSTGQAHTESKPSRLSRFSKSASYGRLQDAVYPSDMPSAPPIATRGPPQPAMAQTPIGVKQNPGFGTGGFVLPLGGFSR